MYIRRVINFVRSASAIASARSETPSLESILLTCDRVVLITLEDARGTIQTVEPSTTGAKPQNTPAVFKDGEDLTVAQAPGIVGIRTVVNEGASFTIRAIQPG